MPLVRLGQVAVAVKDIQRATAFYRETLELPFLFEAPPKLAFFDLSGVRLMLSGADTEQTGGSVLYFLVEDIQAEFTRLHAAGVHFEREAHLVARLPDREIWMAFFRDTDGNLLALMSEPRIP